MMHNSVYMKLIFHFSGGAADPVCCLSTTVAVWIRGGLSSPDRSQAGSAGQGAEACTGLWHHWEGFCAFGSHSGGGQVSPCGVRAKRKDSKNQIGEHCNGAWSVLKALWGEDKNDLNLISWLVPNFAASFSSVLSHIKISDLSGKFQYGLGDVFLLNWSIRCLTFQLSIR